MPSNHWINIPITASHRAMAAGPAGTQAPDSVGVINSSQASITFAGAPAGVTLVWKVLSAISPGIGAHEWVAVVISLVVGMLIYWQSAPTGSTPKQKVLGFVFALINSFAIAAAVLGIDASVQATG